MVVLPTRNLRAEARFVCACAGIVARFSSTGQFSFRTHGRRALFPPCRDKFLNPEVTSQQIMKHARRVASPHVVNINDLRTLARRKVPRVVFDYVDGGAEDEITLRENRRAFEEIAFRPRQAVAIPQCDFRTRVLGVDLSLPFLLAPVGYSRVINASGEVAAARVAGQAGTAYILSTISGYPLEEVRAASAGPVFYQLYILAGREAAEGALERARKAGFVGLFVTVDTAVGGMRERDFRNGMKELLGPSLLGKIRFAASACASRMAHQLFSRWRSAAAAQCGCARPRTDAAD
jgi:isopentenyl diphosphate isomerase/L-lactate dehydrogenase-like FMN-dependent dehydrogenase